MSILQEQAVRLISNLSDDNVKFLIEFMQRFMFAGNADAEDDMALQALHRLHGARQEVWQYLPQDFDPDRELAEARSAKYDCAY